jgi:hypothetical protein
VKCHKTTAHFNGNFNTDNQIYVDCVWLATHSIHLFSLHFPSHASLCAITVQLNSTIAWVHSDFLNALYNIQGSQELQNTGSYWRWEWNYEELCSCCMWLMWNWRNVPQIQTRVNDGVMFMQPLQNLMFCMCGIIGSQWEGAYSAVRHVHWSAMDVIRRETCL